MKSIEARADLSVQQRIVSKARKSKFLFYDSRYSEIGSYHHPDEKTYYDYKPVFSLNLQSEGQLAQARSDAEHLAPLNNTLAHEIFVRNYPLCAYSGRTNSMGALYGCFVVFKCARCSKRCPIFSSFAENVYFCGGFFEELK